MEVYISFFVFGLLLYVLYTYWLKDKQVKQRFKIPFFYKAVLVDDKKRQKLFSLKQKNYLLVGAPDFAFKHFLLNRYIVVEVKSRGLGNGKPYKKEIYQVLLYMNQMMNEYQTHNIKGALSYGDQMFNVKYSRDTVEWLLTDRADKYLALTPFK